MENKKMITAPLFSSDEWVELRGLLPVIEILAVHYREEPGDWIYDIGVTLVFNGASREAFNIKEGVKLFGVLEKELKKLPSLFDTLN